MHHRLLIGRLLLSSIIIAACGSSEGDDAPAGPDGGSSSSEGGTAGSDGGRGAGDGGADAAPDDATPPQSDTKVILTEDWESGTGDWTIEGPAALETDTNRTRSGNRSLRVDFRNPACGAASCDGSGNNCYEDFPQVVSRKTFSLPRYYVSWWVYYPSDFTFYQGPCLPTRGAQGHFVRFSKFRTPPDPNDSFYQGAFPDFGQHNAGANAIGVRAEYQWIENTSGQQTIGRNLGGTPLTNVAGKWNHYEIFVDLGSVNGHDGAITWAVNDEVRFAMYADAVHKGTASKAWGSRAAEADQHPGLMRTSNETFTRLGLVSNPNSSFGGRAGDVYWIDDLVIMDGCPADRPLCAPIVAR